MLRIKLYGILVLVVVFASGCVLMPQNAGPTTPTFTPTPFSLWTSTPPPTLMPTATPEPVEQPAITPETTAVPQPVATQPATTTEYTVAPGDTLFDLAVRYDVPMAAIQIASGMGTDTIVKAGQVLSIPSSDGWEQANPFWVLYEVQPGETLSQIAKSYDLDLEQLKQVNGIEDANMMRVGTLLILPLRQPQSVYGVALASAPLPPAGTTLPPTATAVPEAATTEPEPTQPPAPPPAAVEAPADMSALAAETFRLINEQRAMYGLPALQWNGTLALAAQRHAEDCYQRGYCGHYGSDGSTYQQRLERVGYPYVRWSECWAWYATPELAVAMWMDEVPPNDPHRRTILSEYLLEVGVGVMPGNGNGYYFIADFGATQ